MTQLEVTTTPEATSTNKDYLYFQHLIDRIKGVRDSTLETIKRGIVIVDPDKVDAVRAEIEQLSEGTLSVTVLDEEGVQ